MAANLVTDDVQPGRGAEPAPHEVVGGAVSNPLRRAALIGGAFAAGAGAYFGSRALARRNSKDGKPVNSVMANAITACDVKAGVDGKKGS